MAQTSYSSQPGPGIPGQIADAGYKRAISRVNENASAIAVGIFVKHGVAVNGANIPSLATDVIEGIALRSNQHPITSDLSSATAALSNGEVFEVMELGTAWVIADSDVAMTVNGPVYARFATGTGTIIGAVRATHDSNTARLLSGARCLAVGTSANGQAIAKIFFDRTANDASSDATDFAFAIASAAATTTTVLAKLRADRQYVVDAVDYIEPATGIAQSDTNYYVLTLQNGATVIAQYSTKLTGGNGAITANTFASLVMQALANTVCAPGSTLTFVETLTGSLTAPAGTLCVHGHYV